MTVTGVRHRRGVGTVLVLAALVWGTSAQAQTVPPTPYTVLAILPGSDEPGYAVTSTAIREALQSRADVPVDYFREYLAIEHISGDDAAVGLRDAILRKYRGRRIDTVIAHTTPVRDFVFRFREELFPRVPIVFFGSGSPDPAARASGGGITGIDAHAGHRQTLELALRLHPQTTRVYVLVRALGGQLRDAVRPALGSFASRVELTYVSDLPVRGLLDLLRTLPADAVVLYVQYSADEPGTVLSQTQIAEMIGGASAAPVYGVVNGQIGTGIVGGFLRTDRSLGLQLGSLALRTLTGDRAADIPIEPPRLEPIFDWRQIQRWGIDPARLPPRADIRFREPTAWERYGWQIVATVAAVALQTAIIISLVIQRARRRESERALRISKDRYSLATSAGGVGVWELTLHNEAIYIDDGLMSALGQTHERIRHMDDWLTLMHPDDRAAVRANLKDLIDGRSESYEAERRMIHGDGSTRWFLVRGSAIRQNGRLVRVVGTNTDITERKLAERQLRDVQDQLSQASRLSALGEFAASIAHEVRQPLTAIITSARASLRFLSSGATTEAREALSYVLDAGKRADEVIERNRELFRSHTVAREPLDINSVIADATAMARPRIESGHVALATALADGLPTVAGDRIQLHQVLLNLLVNAIDATEAVHPMARRVEIATALDPSGGIRVSVRDNGVGLGAVDVRKLFSMSYTTKPAGTGVGLSISRSIVDAHGGTIWAESNAGGGATFSFTVPVSDAAGVRQRAAG